MVRWRQQTEPSSEHLGGRVLEPPSVGVAVTTVVLTRSASRCTLLVSLRAAKLKSEARSGHQDRVTGDIPRSRDSLVMHKAQTGTYLKLDGPGAHSSDARLSLSSSGTEATYHPHRARAGRIQL